MLIFVAPPPRVLAAATLTYVKIFNLCSGRSKMSPEENVKAHRNGEIPKQSNEPKMSAII